MVSNLRGLGRWTRDRARDGGRSSYRRWADIVILGLACTTAALLGVGGHPRTTGAQEELFVVNADAVSFFNDSVTVYPRTADDNAPPIRTLTGPATGLNGPSAIFVDPVNEELVVANSGNNTVTVYALTASANTPPLRTLQGGATGLNGPSGIFVDSLNNELVVVNRFGASVTVYARTAKDNTPPLRTLAGADTKLQNPIGLVVDRVNGELLVGNSGNASVTVYARTASDNTAPLRTLAGADTKLSFPQGLAVDGVNSELLVANGTDDSVTVYTRTANANTAPLRRIRGPATGISSPMGLALDPIDNELLVVNVNGSVTVYARTASGNTPPLRTLAGVATGLSSPGSLAVTLPITLAASVLPTERTGRVGGPAVTAFATVLNAGPVTALGCAIAPLTVVPATFAYQTTTAQNALTGTPNTPVDIPAGQGQSYVFAFTPTASFAVTEIALSFACTNSAPAPITSGVNTFRLRATATPASDIVAIALTPSNDGIVRLASTGVFVVATVNVGAPGLITVTADTGEVAVPVTITVCETDPATSLCLAPPTPSVQTQVASGATPTFGVFVSSDVPVPFDPANSRIQVHLEGGGGGGGTSVAVCSVALCP